MKEQHIVEIADKFLIIARKEKTLCKLIDSARKEFESRRTPCVQLYGVSQAGKSTLLSCLTMGEQFIPIGTGKATTAVKVEMVNAASTADRRVEIEWFNPKELLELVRQPLDFFIRVMGENDLEFSKSSSTGAAQDSLSLDRKADREYLQKVLIGAKRVRQQEADKVVVGAGNDLAVAEIILKYYKDYKRESRSGSQKLRDFSQLPKWTRQPYEWGNWEKRPIKAYSFDELRSFFAKRVILHTVTADVAKDIRILDTPGFGVSHLHDRICRSAQEEAEAVVLVLGTQLTEAQMIEIQQLALGLRNNLFIIWNPKDETREHAQEILGDMLNRLKEEAGIVVPGERAIVANLHLALRAMQWHRIKDGKNLSVSTKASLDEMFSRKYGRYELSGKAARESVSYELRKTLEKFIYAPKEVFENDQEKIALALEFSGWTNVVEILEGIKSSRQENRTMKFAVSLLDAMILFLESFPSVEETKKQREALKPLTTILAKIGTKRGTKREEMIEKVESKSEAILDEFLSHLTEPQELENLKSNLKSRIMAEPHYSTVPGEVQSLMKDYADTRCSVWAREFSEFQTPRSKEWVLGHYTEAVFRFEKWINHHNLTVSLEFPSTPAPRIDLGEFRRSFKTWTAHVISRTFSPGWLEKFVSWIKEAGAEIVYQASKAWSWIKTNLLDKTVKPPEKKPSFDRSKTYESVAERIDALFSKSSFDKFYHIGEDPDIVPMSAPSISTGDDNLFTWIEGMRQQIEINNRNAILELCQEFYSCWRSVVESAKRGLDASFTAWTETIESTLKERVSHLNSSSKPLLDQEALEGIEILASQVGSLSGRFENFGENLSKINILIIARKGTTE